MTRIEFIQSLRNALHGLPEDEINDIISDYEEHFEIGFEKGKTEEQIAKELGDPRDIAKMYKASATISNAEKNPSPGNLLKAVFAATALGIFNIIVVLGPFIAILGLLIGLYGLSVGLILGGIGAAFGTIIKPLFPYSIHIVFNPLASVAFGIGMLTLGILLFIASIYLTKALYKGTVKYLKWNIDIIKK